MKIYKKTTGFLKSIKQTTGFVIHRYNGQLLLGIHTRIRQPAVGTHVIMTTGYGSTLVRLTFVLERAGSLGQLPQQKQYVLFAKDLEVALQQRVL